MNKFIAFCGLDCKNCDAYIATINNDNALREKTAMLWCEWNHTDEIKPEHINCLGCRTDGIKTYYCSSLCEIRKCADSKGFGTCKDCPEKKGCKLIEPMLSNEAVVQNIF